MLTAPLDHSVRKMARISTRRWSRSVVAFMAIWFLFAGSLPATLSDEKESRNVPLQVIRPKDLELAARKAPPAIAALYRDLARPADRVVLADGKNLWVAPIAQFVGSRPAFEGELELVVVAGQTAGTRRKVTQADLTSVTPFEQIALEKISRFLAKGSEEGKELSFQEKLPAAEKALQTMAWVHEGTRARSLSGPSPWAEWRTSLHEKLREVRRQQLALRIEQAHKSGWAGALEQADRLLNMYPQDNAVAQEVQKFWAQYGVSRFDAGDYAAARALLTRIDKHFVHSPQAGPLRKALQSRARTLAKEAEKLPDGEAREKLAEALALWPRLPGLRDALLRRQGNFPVLYVGVRQLPEFLSPATAWTDAEKQAVELLFESLVRPNYRPSEGQRYEPQLAAQLPGTQSLLRRCLLRRDAYWSDGERVTSADIRHTVQLRMEADLAGRIPAWNDLVEAPRLEQASFLIDLQLRQGFLDPLSLLTFKVLPQNFRGQPLGRADDPAFAKSPVGSGPFIYMGRREEAGRTMAVFAANPHYHRDHGTPQRAFPTADRTGQPRIREMRFFAWKDAQDLSTPQTRSALLLDVRTEQLRALKSLGIGPVRSVANRRVYFLAVNHRIDALTNLSLRRGLAHAIDREKILNDQFRGGHPELGLLETAGAALTMPLLAFREGHPEFHRPLSGPFPADCWACCPATRVPPVLHDPSRAKSFFRELKKRPAVIKLKYPTDDPRAGRACQEIADQVHELAASVQADIRLQLVGLPPHEFKEAIDRREYELAYYHLDYDDENYWLWPLFDPQAEAVRPGGSNFLGYDNDSKLQSLFKGAMNHRNFSTVKELTHGIHAHMNDHMPLIPLWQLHSHLAIPPYLEPVQLEAPKIFTHVAQWKMTP